MVEGLPSALPGMMTAEVMNTGFQSYK